MELRLQEIDSKKTWEDFLLTHCPQALFQSWLWGEVQKKVGQKIYRLGIFEHNNLLGIAQLFVIRARRGTFLHIRHGPVWQKQEKEYWVEFLRLITPIAKREGAWFIRINPLIETSSVVDAFFRDLGFHNAPIHAMDAEYCWVLGLDKSEEELLLNMRKTTRYEIRRAQKVGVSVISTNNLKDLSNFNKLYEETSKRHGFVKHQGVEEEFEVFGKEDSLTLYLAQFERKIVAGAVILFYGNQAIYHHGASITSKIPGSYLIQWEAIKEAKKRGLKLYNFWGIAPEDKLNHPWRGITLFKKGFGGSEINYVHAKDYAISPLYFIPKSIETVRRKLRGY